MLFIADLGSLHALHPAYNAETALELAAGLGARSLVLAGVSAEDLNSGVWRDQDNPLLFAAHAGGWSMQGVAPPWTAREREAEQLTSFLGQYPEGQRRLRELGLAEAALREVVSRPLDAASVHGADTLSAVSGYHAERVRLLGVGPGTAFREDRLALVERALNALAPGDDVAVLAPLDDLPVVAGWPGARLPSGASFTPGEASRARALLDRAYRLEESDDLERLVASLLALDGPPESPLGRLALEARFAAGGVYLAVGDLESARDLLEAVAQAQFDRPAYLPGFTLARLGQVRDLMGERDAARRAYTAALALAWLPEQARRTAGQGLVTPFALGSEDDGL